MRLHGFLYTSELYSAINFMCNAHQRALRINLGHDLRICGVAVIHYSSHTIINTEASWFTEKRWDTLTAHMHSDCMLSRFHYTLSWFFTELLYPIIGIFAVWIIFELHFGLEQRDIWSMLRLDGLKINSRQHGNQPSDLLLGGRVRNL